MPINGGKETMGRCKEIVDKLKESLGYIAPEAEEEF